MEFHSPIHAPEYIVNTTPLVDHIHCNHDRLSKSKYGDRKWFVIPPKIDIEDTTFFSDELGETAQLKMVELLDRHDFLEKRRSNNIKVIQTISDIEKWNDISEYFYTYIENIDYTEVIYVQRWLQYWKRIYEIASKHKFERVFFEKKDEVTDEDIARAKEYPIQDLFNGHLRHSFGKFTGLCPFHEESSPSFTIFEDDNHFYCFGCNVWGDAIDFYSRTAHVNMIEAVKALNER